MLRPDGTLLDTLGGAGEGPGEFQRLRSVQVARGDSIYAYDFQTSRLTVYAGAPYRLSRTGTIARDGARFGRVHVLGDTLVGAAFNTVREPQEGVQRPDPLFWRLLSETGVPGDTLLRIRPRPFALLKQDRGFTSEDIPFARQTHIAVGPDDRLYTGWSDSLHVTATAPTGQSETVVSVSAPSLPVREADRDSALNDLDGEMRSMVRSALPETKPAFTELIVANDGRIWVRRPAADPDAETVPWWRLDPETKTIRKTRLPETVALEVVRDGKAYGMTQTEMGAPAVVRYRIEDTA